MSIPAWTQRTHHNMTATNWSKTAPTWPDKTGLIKSLKEHVCSSTGIENARMLTLDRVNLDELVLLAMAMGFEPDPGYVERLRRQFNWADEREANQREEWAENQRLRDKQRATNERLLIAQRATAETILAMSDVEVLALAGITGGAEGDDRAAKINAMIKRLTDLT